MDNFVLRNGLKLFLYPMLNTHSITVGLYIKAGLSAEKQNGITHLLEHLHFRQLEEISQKELYYRMEKIGSTLRAATYRDFLKFTMKIAPCYLDECLDIFVSLIETKTWAETSIAKEKQVVINQILEKGDGICIEKAVNEFLFRNHPYVQEIMGTVEDVVKITPQDIAEYKQRIFRLHGMAICITGNIDAVSRRKIISKLQRCNISNQPYDVKTPIPTGFGTRKAAIKLLPIQYDDLLDINLSYDIALSKEDTLFLTLLNCVIGEGVGSRLQSRIREECCYTSNIASFIEWYEDFAFLHIRFSVQKKHLFSCLQEISKIVENVKHDITKQDLEVSLPFYTTNLVFLEDDTEEMNFYLAYYQFILNQPKQQPQVQDLKVTAEQMKNLAKRIFALHNLSLVIVGNTKNIRKKTLFSIIAGQGDGSTVPELDKRNVNNSLSSEETE